MRAIDRSSLPEGSGDKESPEDSRALEVYEARMREFDQLLVRMVPKRTKGRSFHDYTVKNCEEAYSRGERGSASVDVASFRRGG